MSKVSWGKPTIMIKDLDDSNAKWTKMPTPAEDTTELSTNAGDAMEAAVEGGELEDKKYKASNYELAMNIRKLKGRVAPIETHNGVTDHHFAIALQPEDPSCQGMLIDNSAVSCEDTYTPADGAVWKYKFEPLKPDTGDLIKWGVITFGEDNTPTCTPVANSATAGV